MFDPMAYVRFFFHTLKVSFWNVSSKLSSDGWKPSTVSFFVRTIRSSLLVVGNQHKWDRLGPEKIIIMKSCVGAP